MSGRAYLDWAAGAPLHPAAREAFERAIALNAGNPSSVHAEGRAARAVLERAREGVAALAGCAPREVVFTGSATEANAAVVLGLCSAGARIVVSAIEHPSVLQAAAFAERRGASVVRAPASGAGVVGAAAVREALHGEPAQLLALQLANNETGALQPVAEVAAVAREAGAHVHTDAVQAAGKVELGDVWARVDSLALSAHKLGGLPGVGALCLRRGVELEALVPGHQERGLRGGTPALPSIAAFGAVAALAARAVRERAALLADRTAAVERIVRAAAPEALVHAAEAERVPGIVNVRFPGADGETLLVGLDLAGVACSHGAACSTGAMEPSHVLLAMGLSPDEARSTVRFSVGPETTDEELALLARALPGALAAARAPR